MVEVSGKVAKLKEYSKHPLAKMAILAVLNPIHVISNVSMIISLKPDSSSDWFAEDSCTNKWENCKCVFKFLVPMWVILGFDIVLNFFLLYFLAKRDIMGKDYKKKEMFCIYILVILLSAGAVYPLYALYSQHCTLPEYSYDNEQECGCYKHHTDWYKNSKTGDWYDSSEEWCVYYGTADYDNGFTAGLAVGQTQGVTEGQQDGNALLAWIAANPNYNSDYSSSGTGDDESSSSSGDETCPPPTGNYNDGYLQGYNDGCNDAFYDTYVPAYCSIAQGDDPDYCTDDDLLSSKQYVCGIDMNLSNLFLYILKVLTTCYDLYRLYVAYRDSKTYFANVNYPIANGKVKEQLESGVSDGKYVLKLTWVLPDEDEKKNGENMDLSGSSPPPNRTTVQLGESTGGSSAEMTNSS